MLRIGRTDERLSNRLPGGTRRSSIKDVLEGGAELLLTAMSDSELLDLVKLDIHSAQED